MYYAIKESGYVSLFPFVDLGNDLSGALYAVGCRKDKRPISTQGYAVKIGKYGYRLRSDNVFMARNEAIYISKGQECLLLKAVARGKVTVWEKVEKIFESSLYLPYDEIRNDGVVLEKAMDIRNSFQFFGFVKNIADKIKNELEKKVLPKLTSFLEEETLNFEHIEPEIIESEWIKSNKKVKNILGGGHLEALETYTSKIKTSLLDIGNDNKALLKRTYLPQISTSLNQRDQKVVDKVSSQVGWWVRDSSGAISDKLTEQGRRIITDGISQGLGRSAIARQLKKEIPNLYGKNTFNYASTVAAVGVSRARSFSEITSYQEAGISYFEIVAMLDERTTDICRALDGTIMDVQVAYQHQLEIANIKNPEDIKTVSPFFTEHKNKETGLKEISLGRSKFADVQRSGLGNVDDRGIMSKFLSTRSLQRSGVSMPPYHYNCRTTTVPRVDMIQVPKNYDVVSETVAATDNPKKTRKKPVNRPIRTTPSPTKKKPVVTSQTPIDRPVLRVPDRVSQKVSKLPKGMTQKQVNELNEKLENVEKLKIQLAEANKELKMIKYKTKKGTSSKKYYVPTKPDSKIKTGKVPTSSKKYKAPKPSKHPVANLKKSKKTAIGQLKENKKIDGMIDGKERTKIQNKMAKDLKKDQKFMKMVKTLGYENEKDFIKTHNLQWNISSRDDSKEMHYMQLAIHKEFGLPDATLKQLNKKIVSKISNQKNYNDVLDGYRSFVRAQYDSTQGFLKSKKVKELSLVRGLSFNRSRKPPSNIQIDGQKRDTTFTSQPLSSFSTDHNTAKDIAKRRKESVLLKQSVPRERIFSLHQTGMGMEDEYEVIVIGGENDYTEAVGWKKNEYSDKTVLEELFK